MDRAQHTRGTDPREVAAPAILPRGRVPVGTVLAYGVPVLGLSSLLFFVQFFFLKFATDVLLLTPALIGVVFGLGRAWDAFSDPVVGSWSDRTRTRLGRRRPWMFGAIPAIAVTFIMIWIPPEGLARGWLSAWAAVSLFAFYGAFTAYIIPHSSLGAELTDDHHDRSRIFGVRHAAFTLGMMCAFGGMQIVTNSAEPRATAALLATVASVGVAGILLVPPVALRERPEYQGRVASRPWAAMRSVLRNPHARLLVTVQFIEMTGAGVLGVLSPYVVVYVLKRPELIGPLPAIFIACSVLSIPLWVRASRRFGKRQVWVGAMVAFAFAFGSTVFVGENDVALISVLLIVAGIAAGCGGAVGPSILADVIDYDESVTGERREGIYSASWGFAIKAANASIILLTGFVLQLSGFRPNVDQTATAELAIRLLYAGAPFTMFLTGAWLFRRFRLDEREHARIRATIEQRRSGGAAA